jgi:hypothetical protein
MALLSLIFICLSCTRLHCNLRHIALQALRAYYVRLNTLSGCQLASMTRSTSLELKRLRDILKPQARHQVAGPNRLRVAMGHLCTCPPLHLSIGRKISRLSTRATQLGMTPLETMVRNFPPSPGILYLLIPPRSGRHVACDVERGGFQGFDELACVPIPALQNLER